MKKSILALFLLAALLTLAACGGSAPATEPQTTAAEVPTYTVETVPPTEPMDGVLMPYLVSESDLWESGAAPVSEGIDGFYQANFHYVDADTIRLDVLEIEVFPAQAVDSLEKGDKICIGGDVWTVDKVEMQDGNVFLNDFKIQLMPWEMAGYENDKVLQSPKDYLVPSETGMSHQVVKTITIDVEPDTKCMRYSTTGAVNEEQLSAAQFMEDLKNNESAYRAGFCSAVIMGGKVVDISAGMAEEGQGGASASFEVELLEQPQMEEEGVILPYLISHQVLNFESDPANDPRYNGLDGYYPADVTYVDDDTLSLTLYADQAYHKEDMDGLKKGSKILVGDEVLTVDKVSSQPNFRTFSANGEEFWIMSLKEYNDTLENGEDCLIHVIRDNWATLSAAAIKRATVKLSPSTWFIVADWENSVDVFPRIDKEEFLEKIQGEDNPYNHFKADVRIDGGMLSTVRLN